MHTKRLLSFLFLMVFLGVGLLGCVGLESTLVSPTQAGYPAPPETTTLNLDGYPAPTAPATPTSQPSPSPIEGSTQEAAVSETNSPQSSESKPDNPLIQQAKEDLAARLKLDIEAIELLAFELVTWPDSSLGCPQPGMAYTQVPVDGSVIRLAAGDETYEYHTGGTRGPFLCEQDPKIPNLKPTLPKIDLLITPPDTEND